MADLFCLIGVVASLHIGLSETSRRNLALNKPAWSSCKSTWDDKAAAAAAVDGENNTCIPPPCIGNPRWLVVDLLALYHIQDVSIYTEAGNLHDFTLEIYETNPSRYRTAAPTPCKNYTRQLGSLKTISCERPFVGRYVRLRAEVESTSAHGVLRLCEIKVYGIKHAYQTSNYIRMPEGRLIPPLVKSSALSRVSCVQQCMLSGACVGVNYNSGTRECELLGPWAEPTHTVPTDPDWVYYRDDMC